MSSRHSAVRWIGRTWPLLLLCAIACTSWLVVERYPQAHFNLAGDALACAISAGICFLFRTRQGSQTAGWGPGALGGALILVGPAVPSLLATQTQPGGFAIALTLTSVVVAVALPAFTDSELSPSALWPGIAAASALLIALPVPGLADWRSDVALILAPLAAGIGAILYRRSGRLAANAMPLSLTLSAMVFGIAAAAQWRVQHVPPRISVAAIALDAALFVLPLLALKQMSALQYTARYVLVPFLLLVEGALLVSRSLITFRTGMCALLLLMATVGLLRSPNEENAA